MERAFFNSLLLVMKTSKIKNEAENREHNELIGSKYLLVMKQLRQMDLLKRQDIQKDGLLEELCYQRHFAEKRSLFLVEWDPAALTESDEYGYTPIRHAATRTNSIRGFQSIFEYGMNSLVSKQERNWSSMQGK
jgi:hypothetical protein